MVNFLYPFYKSALDLNPPHFFFKFSKNNKRTSKLDSLPKHQMQYNDANNIILCWVNRLNSMLACRLLILIVPKFIYMRTKCDIELKLTDLFSFVKLQFSPFKNKTCKLKMVWNERKISIIRSFIKNLIFFTWSKNGRKFSSPLHFY